MVFRLRHTWTHAASAAAPTPTQTHGIHAPANSNVSKNRPASHGRPIDWLMRITHPRRRLIDGRYASIDAAPIPPIASTAVPAIHRRPHAQTSAAPPAMANRYTTPQYRQRTASSAHPRASHTRPAHGLL